MERGRYGGRLISLTLSMCNTLTDAELSRVLRSLSEAATASADGVGHQLRTLELRGCSALANPSIVGNALHAVTLAGCVKLEVRMRARGALLGVLLSAPPPRPRPHPPVLACLPCRPPCRCLLRMSHTQDRAVTSMVQSCKSLAVLDLSGCTSLREPALGGALPLERIVLTGTSLGTGQLLTDEHTIIVR